MSDQRYVLIDDQSGDRFVFSDRSDYLATLYSGGVHAETEPEPPVVRPSVTHGPSPSASPTPDGE